MDHSTQQLIDKFKRNPAIAQSLLQSGDGQRLMQMLTSQDGGAALNHAAQNAAAGNTKELATMLSNLMKSPEGMAIMNRINDKKIRTAGGRHDERVGGKTEYPALRSGRHGAGDEHGAKSVAADGAVRRQRAASPARGRCGRSCAVCSHAATAAGRSDGRSFVVARRH